MTSDRDANQAFPLVEGGGTGLALILRTDGSPARSIACRRVVTLVGSRKGCKIHIQQRSVMPIHLALVNDGKQVSAIDLVTQDGTSLNELPLRYEPLADGDRLAIGSFAFDVSVSPRTAVSDDGVQIADYDDVPHAYALEHLPSGRVLKPNREICLLGRMQGCDIAIADPRVSRVHALLMNYHGQPHVVDLLSENGTHINNDPVSFRQLVNDDMLLIGDTSFRVRVVSGRMRSAPQTNGTQARPHAANGSANGNGKADDLIDIYATESRSKWHIVDHYEKAMKKQG